MIDPSRVEVDELSRIGSYVPTLFLKVKPLLEDLDPAVLAGDTSIILEFHGRHPYLEIAIVPKQADVPGAYLYASAGRCSLSVFGGEYLEDNHPDEGTEELIDQVHSILSRYLGGVTIIDHLSSKGKVIKREGYFGLAENPSQSDKIATSASLSSPFRKTATTSTTRFTFQKQRAPNQAL